MLAAGFDPDRAPFTTYTAQANLTYLDLSNADVLNVLGLVPAELHLPWRTSKAPTKTQLLGQALSLQKRISALRFPSEAALSQGQNGYNVVVYRDSIVPPSHLGIFTGEAAAIQQWP
jgi:hypothetical protein